MYFKNQRLRYEHTPNCRIVVIENRTIVFSKKELIKKTKESVQLHWSSFVFLINSFLLNTNVLFSMTTFLQLGVYHSSEGRSEWCICLMLNRVLEQIESCKLDVSIYLFYSDIFDWYFIHLFHSSKNVWWRATGILRHSRLWRIWPSSQASRRPLSKVWGQGVSRRVHRHGRNEISQEMLFMQSMQEKAWQHQCLFSWKYVLKLIFTQGRVVQSPISVNPGLTP